MLPFELTKALEYGVERVVVAEVGGGLLQRQGQAPQPFSDLSGGPLVV